ncbi:hypothetical protein ACLB2K_045995 [Fragaria x ananassa]
MALFNEFATLEELGVGVVTTFEPTERHFGGSLPLQQDVYMCSSESKFPHQNFIYFFCWAEKLNPNKSRHSRRVGNNGQLGTWSASEPKPIYVSGVQEAFGTLRKFRYEKKRTNKKNKNEIDITDEHHGAWLMDEFTINHSPDLALCRIKVNDKGGDRTKRKSCASAEQNEQPASQKRVACLSNKKALLPSNGPLPVFMKIMIKRLRWFWRTTSMMRLSRWLSC